MSAPPEDAQTQARRLLVEANLNRMRGQHQAAETLCRQAIAASPNSPAAWALLGDALAAQGRREEAAEAYRASLGIADDPMLRSRLEELLREPATAPPPSEGRAEEEARGASSKTIWAVVGSVVALVLFGAVIALVVSSRRSAPVRASAPSPPTAPEAPSVPAWAVWPPPSGPSLPATPPGATVRTIRDRSAAPAPEPLIPRRPTQGIPSADRRVINITKIRSPLTARERRIVYELSRIVLSDGKPIGNRYCSAMINPGTGRLVLTFEVPPEISASPSRSLILGEAARLALGAARADSGFETCAVRVIAGWTSPRTGARRLDVVFIGEADRSSLARGLSKEGAGTRPTEVFKQVWWNPRVGE